MDETSEASDRDILAEAKKAFEVAVEAENDNRDKAADDLRFARCGEQWPEEIRKQREVENRPCHTFNRLPAFIRQVVNDARQNKPSIKVHPADSNADPETANIINGLIRNIEYTSNAEVAYDTAAESAISMGWGYFKIGIDYAHDDAFDLDIHIERVANPFAIYGDPYSQTADSSDWNSAFELEWLTKEDFTKQFPDEDPANWEAGDQCEEWVNGDMVLIARWWERVEISIPRLLLSNGMVISVERAEQVVAQTDLGPITFLDTLAAEGITIQKVEETKTWQVRSHLLSGGSVLKTEPWPGRFIPIVPVYGDEVFDEKGKRHLRSLIHDAKDAQRDYNYWRTTATERVALTPKAPWIGKKGSFKSDARRWATANTVNHPYLEYDGDTPPQRQPLDMGPAAGALQQAMAAADDMKATIGLYNPSMGAQSNEVSGRAIIARERQGDVGTFHFTDNLSRAIRHAGRVIIDLIPHVYTGQRIIRVMGEDGYPENVQLNQPVPQTGPDGKPIMQPQMGLNGQPMVGPDGNPILKAITRVYDLTVGKYDLTVSTGPSYTTQRLEAADQMMELLRVMPQATPLIGDLVAKNLDWPGADEIAKRLRIMLPPQLNGGPPPEVQQMIEQGKAQIAQQGQLIQQMQAYILQLEQDRSANLMKAQTGQYDAETKRLKAVADIQEQGQHVPDAPGPDYEGVVAAAKANHLNAVAAKENAQADLARAKTLNELMPAHTPAQQHILHATHPRQQF
jgi:hypothetical protein